MSEIPDFEKPAFTYWGIHPTLARRFEPTSDLVQLVILHLESGKGMTVKTSRPYVEFLRMAHRIVTGITGTELNQALSCLTATGSSVVQRKEESGLNSTFLFYLELEEEDDVPTDEPFEVDPKLVMNSDFRSLRRAPVAKPVDPEIPEEFYPV